MHQFMDVVKKVPECCFGMLLYTLGLPAVHLLLSLSLLPGLCCSFPSCSAVFLDSTAHPIKYIESWESKLLQLLDNNTYPDIQGYASTGTRKSRHLL